MSVVFLMLCFSGDPQITISEAIDHRPVDATRPENDRVVRLEREVAALRERLKLLEGALGIQPGQPVEAVTEAESRAFFAKAILGERLQDRGFGAGWWFGEPVDFREFPTEGMLKRYDGFPIIDHLPNKAAPGWWYPDY